MIYDRRKLATILVQRGTLRKGSILIAGTAWAKVFIGGITLCIQRYAVKALFEMIVEPLIYSLGVLASNQYKCDFFAYQYNLCRSHFSHSKEYIANILNYNKATTLYPSCCFFGYVFLYPLFRQGAHAGLKSLRSSFFLQIKGRKRVLNFGIFEKEVLKSS